MTGALLEISWTAELEQELAKWIEDQAQLPMPTTEDFATAEMIARFLARVRGETALSVRALFRILSRHAGKCLDLEVQGKIEQLWTAQTCR